MRIVDFTLTRFQFARDRVVGDSQVRAEQVNVATIELVDEAGRIGLGFAQTLFATLPDLAEIERVFRAEIWPGIEGQEPSALAHRVTRPRGGNQLGYSLPFEESIQHAVWDLFAKQLNLPLWQMLGGRPRAVRAYASGLDFHLSDDEFAALFSNARALGYRAFKMKVGHADFDVDLRRLKILSDIAGPAAKLMIDANEAWTAKETVTKLEIIKRQGHHIYWVEDPILRDDFDGLSLLRQSCPGVLINSGEYLDASGKRKLLAAGGTDILNLHGQVTDVMRLGWLASEIGVPVSIGNSFLEIGAHMALALPEVNWFEYSFQNFDFLVQQTLEIKDGFVSVPARPGHGLELSKQARTQWSRPQILASDQLGEAPLNPPYPSRLELATGGT